jgi:hypothetical protein
LQNAYTSWTILSARRLTRAVCSDTSLPPVPVRMTALSAVPAASAETRLTLRFEELDVRNAYDVFRMHSLLAGPI